jgi:hypothetical protein
MKTIHILFSGIKILYTVYETPEPRRDEMTGGWRKLLNDELITCTLLQVQLE